MICTCTSDGYSTFCAVVPFYSLLELFLPVCATDNAPLGVVTFFGGVVAGVASVVLIEVCVLGVIKWRRRMKEPAASKEKEGIRFVHFNITILYLVCVNFEYYYTVF